MEIGLSSFQNLVEYSETIIHPFRSIISMSELVQARHTRLIKDSILWGKWITLCMAVNFANMNQVPYLFHISHFWWWEQYPLHI